MLFVTVIYKHPLNHTIRLTMLTFAEASMATSLILMKIQRFNKQGAFKLILIFFKLTVVYFALSIPINYIFGNKIFDIDIFYFPYGMSLGFPPFYSFFLVGHQYVLHGFDRYIIENIIVLLIVNMVCAVINIPNKIINYLFGISVLVIVFYLTSFIYCYIRY